jgi:hypothetical protein
MVTALTMKEEEVLALLILGPLTMAELRNSVAGGESMVRGILEHLRELGKIRVDYHHVPGTPSHWRGKAIYSAVR